jgi:hypothetical protein
VWSWKRRGPNGEKLPDHQGLLPDFGKLRLKGRELVALAYDSDITAEHEAWPAYNRLARELKRRGVRQVKVVTLPALPEVRGKVGLDDFLLHRTPTDFWRLVAVAPDWDPNAVPAEPVPPTVEVLEEAPPRITRPLALVGEHGYAATWVWVKETITEALDAKGRLVQYDPPQERTSRRLLIVRDDGVVFGDGGDRPMSELGVEVCLPEPPPPDRLWSAAGLRRYREGYRPDPRDVFRRVAAVVDRFIDFSRSLADQNTMCELTACHVMATYFLPALNVIGYLWPNGDKGSGKTHFLFTHTEMAYLGQVILAGGSYPALRDLADYGATLAFDDAERIMDPKRGDPDKQALLLAGNRRGCTVALKEQVGKSTWRTRYVNAFCPRLFSAIGLPNDTLGRRTIVIPLVRTADRRRGNADPLDHSEWPCDRQQLIDDLWAVALHHLARFGAYEKEAADRARLSGAALQPWRAILGVALWLEEHGETGLYAKLEDLAVAYQGQKVDLEVSDLTRLTVQALLELAGQQGVPSAPGKPGVPSAKLTFETATLCEIVNRLAEEEELGSAGQPFATAQRVGKVLRKLRLEKPPRPGGKGSRTWAIKLTDLEALAVGYGLKTTPFQDALGTLGETGTLGTGPVPAPEGVPSEPSNPSVPSSFCEAHQEEVF